MTIGFFQKLDMIEGDLNYVSRSGKNSLETAKRISNLKREFWLSFRPCFLSTFQKFCGLSPDLSLTLVSAGLRTGYSDITC